MIKQVCSSSGSEELIPHLRIADSNLRGFSTAENKEELIVLDSLHLLTTSGLQSESSLDVIDCWKGQKIGCFSYTMIQGGSHQDVVSAKYASQVVDDMLVYLRNPKAINLPKLLGEPPSFSSPRFFGRDNEGKDSKDMQVLKDIQAMEEITFNVAPAPTSFSSVPPSRRSS